MVWTVSANGTITSVISTSADQVLTSDGTPATYYFEVDASAMIGGDVLELRIYDTTLSSGTLRLAWKSVYGPVPPVLPICASSVHPSDQGIRVALRQTAGSPRAFQWKLLRQPQGSGLSPPSQAAAAGMHTLVFNDTFAVDSVARSGQTTNASGINWFPFQNSGLPLADCIVDTTAGTLKITTDTSGYSFGLCTVASASPAFGTWKYGYFTADVLFNPTGYGGSGAWPAFWMLDPKIIGVVLPNGGTFAELDVVEAYPNGSEGATSGNNGVTVLTTAHKWTSNGITNNGTNVQNSDVATLPGGSAFDFTQYHSYGVLWTATTVTWYIDNVVACGPVTITSTFPELVADALYMVIGTGLNWAATFRNIRIWQAP